MSRDAPDSLIICENEPGWYSKSRALFSYRRNTLSTPRGSKQGWKSDFLTLGETRWSEASGYRFYGMPAEPGGDVFLLAFVRSNSSWYCVWRKQVPATWLKPDGSSDLWRVAALAERESLTPSDQVAGRASTDGAFRVRMPLLSLWIACLRSNC